MRYVRRPVALGREQTLAVLGVAGQVFAAVLQAELDAAVGAAPRGHANEGAARVGRHAVVVVAERVIVRRFQHEGRVAGQPAGVLDVVGEEARMFEPQLAPPALVVDPLQAELDSPVGIQPCGDAHDKLLRVVVILRAGRPGREGERDQQQRNGKPDSSAHGQPPVRSCVDSLQVAPRR